MRTMRALRRSFVPAVIALAAPAPPGAAAPPAAEGIGVNDFAGGRIYTLSQTPPIRRGGTSEVFITKHLIDLVPFDQVEVSGAGATPGTIRNGRDAQGIGFISVRVTVPSDAALGALITLRVGLIDRFTFRVVNRGEVASITKNPDPSTIASGTAWVATVSGTDIGSPVVTPNAPACHTATVNEGSRTAGGVQFTLRRDATCSTSSSYVFRLAGSAANDPPSWASATGRLATFTFSYAAPGVVCTSVPGIGAPIVNQPANGQTMVFSVGTPSPAPVTIAWERDIAGVPAPNNEWVITRTIVQSTGGTFSMRLPVTTEVTGTSTSISFPIPGTHSFTIRAKNCGQTAPSTTVTFSTQYQ
jgi:hypothetical protein